MCGRFARRSTREVLAEWFGIDLEDAPEFAPSYNVAPQSVQPIVRLVSDGGQREFALLRWGLVPYWARDAKIGYSTINARAEEVQSKPAFRDALRSRRCLVPADAFYEWQKRDAKNKQPFAIALESRGPFAFAGLWEKWYSKDVGPLESFTILTTGPNQVLQPIHDRMPVILEPHAYRRWLEPTSSATLDNQLLELLRPFPAELMIAWPVSARVGNVRNDDPELLAPSA